MVKGYKQNSEHVRKRTFHRRLERSIEGGYVVVWDGDRKIVEHRLVIERYLGRRLTKKEIVHHKNENRLDNRIENLEVMTSKDHLGHHRPNPATEASLRALLKANENRVFTLETRAKMSASQKGKKRSDETKIKMSLAHKGKPKSLKHRIGISEGLKRHYGSHILC